MVGRTSVRPEKEAFVKSLVGEINKTPIVGIFDVHKLPASALQKIKYQLYGNADIRSIKKSILARSFENSNKKELAKYVTGQPGLILTTMNPFKLYSVIVKSKSVNNLH